MVSPFFMTEKIARVLASEQTKEVWRDHYNSIEWKEASELNKLLFGMPLNKRPKCYCLEDLFFMLKTSKSQTKIQMEAGRKFKLRKGITVSNHRLPNMLTEHSSEEEIIFALSILPHVAGECEFIPENWKEIVEAEQAVEANEVLEENVPTENIEIEEPVLMEEDVTIETVTDYSKWKNADLLALCIDKGITVPPNSNKKALIALLNA